MSMDNKLNVLLKILLIVDKVVDFVIGLLTNKDEVTV